MTKPDLTNFTELLLEEALSLPGAIFIRDDLSQYRDPTHIGYEIGIQQSRQHKRFANIFYDGDYDNDGRPVLYFKHDPATITATYARYPGQIKPSEIAADYWSCLSVTPGLQAVASQLLARSYQLVLASLPKTGQAAIHELAGQTGQFLAFHNAVLALTKQPEVYLRYFGYGDPALLVGRVSKPVAQFHFNTVIITRPDGSQQTLDAAECLDWPGAMTAVVASHCGRSADDL